MPAILRPLRAVVVAGAAAGVLAYVAAAVLTVADVIGRRFGLPIVGVVDLVQLFVLSGAWLVIPYAFLTGAHVGVDLLVDSFPSGPRRLFRTIAAVAACILLALMLYECVNAFKTQLMFGDRSQQLGIPVIWYWVPLLAGLVLSILATLLTLVPQPAAGAAR